MTRLRLSDLAILLMLMAAAPAIAQMQTGSILVRVTDDQGAAVPGVAVTLTSPVLVAGSMSGVTDGSGVNRFPSLQPGMYVVKLDLQLQLATVAETVTVTGASPVVDTTSANTSVNLGEQLLQGTPGGRDIWSLVEYKVPSLLITRPDVGGTSGGLQGVQRARHQQHAELQLSERHQRR